MCREIWNKESVIEKIVTEAKVSVAAAQGSVPGTSEEATFMDAVSRIMDQYLDKIGNVFGSPS